MFKINRILIVFVLLLSCQNNQDITSFSNIEKFKFILDKESFSIPYVKSEKMISVDKEIMLDQGTVFIVQSYSGDDKIYSFWAMVDDSSKITIWSFGGIFWGKINKRYEELARVDSLPVLIEKGKWWDNEEIWNIILLDKEAYGFIEYEY